MPSNTSTLFLTLQFLESSRREVCQKHMDNYLRCSEDKNNKFQDCYLLHMVKFENCMKSLEIIKQLNRNDY